MQHLHPDRNRDRNLRSIRSGSEGPGRVEVARITLAIWLAVVLLPCVSSAQPVGGGELESAVSGAVPADELRARRAALAREVGEGVILIEARGDEETAVTRDFFYLTGLETTEATLLLECDGGVAKETLFLPPRSSSFELWHGSRAFPGPAAADRTGVAEIRSSEKLRTTLERVLESATALYYLPTRSPRPEVESADLQWAAALRSRYPSLARVESVAPALGALRQVKGPDELLRLERAVAITARAFEAAFAVVNPGGTEYQIEAAIEGTFRCFGAEGPGFASIVGAGAHSCVLHYRENQGPVVKGDLVVIDVGASWGGYTADITRTVPATGVYSERQREIYAVVARAQAAGIAAARPGATLGDIHRAARDVFQAEGLAQFFPHGTSHHVGLAVHDVGSTRRPLEPGMVITIEPGLYIPKESLGIRIEDMVVITTEGCTVLSEAIPRTPDALEAAIEAAGGGGTGDATDAERPPRKTL